MAFADYFGKNLQAASFLLQGVDPDAFKEVLSKDSVGIAFDENAVGTPEGRATLDLVTRLLARLFPSLSYVPLDASAKRYAKSLEVLANAINPKIDIGVGIGERQSRLLVVGKRCPSVWWVRKRFFAAPTTGLLVCR